MLTLALRNRPPTQRAVRVADWGAVSPSAVALSATPTVEAVPTTIAEPKKRFTGGALQVLVRAMR